MAAGADTAEDERDRNTDRFGSLRITSYDYASAGRAGHQISDLEAIRDDARELMADPTVQLETQDGLGLDATCDESFD